jgi:hypothetical protein
MQNYRVEERRAFDVTGFLLSGVGLSSLMYGLTLLGRENGSWFLTAAFLLLGAVLVWMALRHGRRHPTPLVELAPLRIPSFAAATVTGGALFRLTIGATPFLWPLMFQVGFGMTAFLSGLLVMACTAGDLGAATMSRPIIRRFGLKPVMVTGGIVCTVFIFACVFFTRQTPFVAIIVVLAVIGVFRSLQFTSISSLAYCDVPQAQMSAASTLVSTIQQLSMGVGVAFGAFALNSIAFVRGNAAGTLDATDFRLAFVAIGITGLLATIAFVRLPADAGASVTGRAVA